LKKYLPEWEKGRPWLKYVDDKGMVCTACTEFGESISHWNLSSVRARRPLLKDSVKFQVQTQSLSLNVVKEKEKEEDIEKKGQNENEGY